MDNQNSEAHGLIVKARDALRRGDKETAHSLAEQAALLAPGMEDAWLILTVSDSNPEDALAYAQQALEINPSSERALRAVEWAIGRLKQAQTSPEAAAGAATPVPTEQEKLQETKTSINRTWLYVGAALVLLLCVAAVFMVYQGVTNPTISSILNNSFLNKVAEPTPANQWAPMDLPKPSLVPGENGESPLQSAGTPTAGPTLELPTIASTQTVASSAIEAFTSTPGADQLPGVTETTGGSSSGAAASIPGVTETPGGSSSGAAAQLPGVTETTGGSSSGAAASIPQVTETPGVMSMEMVSDVQTSEPAPPSSSSSPAPLPAAASNGSGARWIDVDLTNQMVYAYEGETVVNSFLVSTGTWSTPTVTGQYKIYVKYRSAPMSGPGYYLPDVPYIMYFHGDYGLHGTYWHNNFGTPMSHGCVNLRTDEAAWLYQWASVGTLVNIHY